jgi:hypothetical protein
VQSYIVLTHSSSEVTGTVKRVAQRFRIASSRNTIRNLLWLTVPPGHFTVILKLHSLQKISDPLVV